MTDPNDPTTILQPTAGTPAPTPVAPPAAKPPAPAPTPHESALHAHFIQVLHKLHEVEAFTVDGLKKLGVFVEQEAPVVAGVAAAVASVIPGVGPAAAAVAKVAGAAGAVAGRVSTLVQAAPPKR